MATASVVVNLDVLEDGSGCLLACPELLQVHELGLERVEEALHRRVVPAVTLSAHARPKAVLLKQSTVRLAGVLDSAVGVMDEPRLRAPQLQGHAQGLQCELRAEGPAHGPTDHATRIEILD